VVRAGIPDEFVTHGSVDELNKLCGLDIQGLAKRMQTVLDKDNDIQRFKDFNL
jgi:1-deoxy-D-xylulose-5-phosphate synthase